jgi:cytochrome c
LHGGQQTGYLTATTGANPGPASPVSRSRCAMDSFELNKILGAVLFTFLCILGLNIAAGAIVSPREPAKPGYEIAIPEKPEGGAAPAAAPQESIAQLLANADPKRGEQIAKVCQTCHTFEKGGANKVGPNLWGIVGRPKVEPGFNYSAAMKAKGGDWTIDELNQFLTSPKGFIPGTAMSFAGLPKGQQRADVIDYLNTLSDNPKPLPTAAEAKPTEGAKPTAGGESHSK